MDEDFRRELEDGDLNPDELKTISLDKVAKMRELADGIEFDISKPLTDDETIL